MPLARAQPLHPGGGAGAAVSAEDNKRVVATFGRCARTSPTWPSRTKSSHAAFVNHDAPGRAVDCRRQPPPVEHFNHFYGMLLQAFPDASMEINEQVAERDLGPTRKTLRGTTAASPGP